MITEWNIQSRGHGCAACGRSFTDKEVYHTLLFEEKAELQRSDICRPCWDQQYSQGAQDRKGFVSYWQGVFQAPPPPTEPIQKETAETLLRKLIELNDPQYVPAAYILAVMLERKRLLKVKEQLVREGKRIFIYEHPGSGDVFSITDPNLRLDQLEQVQRDVGNLLEYGLNPPPDSVSAQPEATASSESKPDPGSVESAPVEEQQTT